MVTGNAQPLRLSADFVRARRRALKLTQAELAYRAGISEATMRRVERGKGAGAKTIAALAFALDVRIDALFTAETAA